MLFLKEANLEDAYVEYQMISQMPADENGMTNPDVGCTYEQFTKEVLPRIIKYSHGEDLPEGWVPETHFFLWDEDRIVGLFRLRHCLNENLRKYHGHIGYAIHKGERGKGYASAGLSLVIEKARNMILEEEIYLSVHKDNKASLKVQIKDGARIVREDDINFYTRIPIEELSSKIS